MLLGTRGAEWLAPTDGTATGASLVRQRVEGCATSNSWLTPAQPLGRLDAIAGVFHARAMLERHGGGCLCGDIRFVMTGKPMNTSICYCTQCQRQSGAPMPAFATCRAEQLTLTAGEPVSYRSSERATRYFCARCGSSLFWIEDGSDERDVYLGTFDKPGLLPVPRHAIWVAHRVAWLPDLAWIPSYPAARGDDD